jgi:uncharacterized membrane protein
MQTEPAVLTGVILAVISAVLALVVAFGVDVSTDQAAAIMGTATAVLALIGAVIVRSRVTPVP